MRRPGSSDDETGAPGPAAGPSATEEAGRRLKDLWERLPPEMRALLTRLVGRLPSYVRLAWNLVRDPELTHRQKLGVYAGGLYNLSPIDAVPGIIPILGQLDDYAALLLGIRTTLRACDPEVRRRHLAACNCTEERLDEDIVAIRRVAGLITGKVARAAWTPIRDSGRAWYQMGQNLVRKLKDEEGKG
jgi:uncharacterized membrane protein YkvA (DUF1232 family)